MKVEGDGFCIMELARMLSFRDVCRILKHTSEVQLPADISSSEPIESDVSEEDGTASEPNNSQFIRLPRDFEISLSEANGSLLNDSLLNGSLLNGSLLNQIQCLITLRDCASQPEEFYSSLSKEQWLRTVVKCKSKGALVLCSGDFSENDFRDLTIQCNVVPCEPYWEKLQRARSSQDNNAGATSKGVYFRSSSLEYHVSQLTRDDQQEYNVLEDWIERYDNEMIDQLQTDMIPGRLSREIKPSDGDLKRKALSSGEDDPPGRFRKEFWRGGRFGVKVFKEDEKNTFSKEVEILEAIGTHKHIVYSFGVSKPEKEDRSYKYWMENLDGNLFELITKLVCSRDLPFSVIDSMDILLQFAKAMTRLHELKVIHGDLKPDNILVSHCEVLGDVKLYIVKVADFDKAEIVKSDDDEVVHMTGTDEYMAPEAFEARESGTLMSGSNAKKCDVYSFGIVAFEVLSGQSSEGIQIEDFDRDRRDDIMAPLEVIGSYHIYPDLIDLVARCLNHDSSLRPSFAEVTEELEYVIGDVSN